ncbi:MAG TPA: hypothetical protein VFV76_14975 [Actinomycetes bacterium]|nr:hypothetical protein [Actinomycetes bacterium]
MSGLAPVESPRTDSGLPFDLPEDGAGQLRRSGYISTTYQSAEGDSSAGVSSVLLLETEAGAHDWMAYETSDEGIRHQIPAPPGGQDPTCTAMRSATSTGPRAIYERTGGTCPD